MGGTRGSVRRLDFVFARSACTRTFLPSMDLRRKLTHEECLNGYSQFFCKLYQKIATEKLTVMGPAITIYHNPSCDPFEFEIEFAVPIKEVVTGTRDFQNGLCVKSTLNGSYANITSIYARQQEWAESNGYDFIRSPFELYITEPNATNTPDDYITEIYYPVIKRR